ncbi:hypothetical protein GCM10023313_24210 [Mucilaginibacter defluvii]|uniref:Uncharacterized protein n=1 Tax=Mucilaginibacter defluvii TaxID=1196019 RepID=A0ABP9FWR6_9SPHI
MAAVTKRAPASCTITHAADTFKSSSLQKTIIIMSKDKKKMPNVVGKKMPSDYQTGKSASPAPQIIANKKKK